MTQQMINLREQEPALMETGIAVRYFHHYTSPQWANHGHDIVEMNFVVSGTGEHLIDNQITVIKPGTLGITHYNQTHAFRTTQGGLNLYNIYLDPLRHPLPDIGPELRMQIPRFIPLHPEFKHNYNRVLHLTFATPKILIGILRAMSRESDMRATGYREALQAGYRLFMIECARQLLKNDPTPLSHISPTTHNIETLRNFIDTSFTQPLTLKILAKKAGFTTTYLCRIFKEHTGKSIIHYLIQRRIEAAMLQLSTTSHKILAIAFECGFQDLSHFNRTFKKITGSTPGEYRKKIQNTE